MELSRPRIVIILSVCVSVCVYYGKYLSRHRALARGLLFRVEWWQTSEMSARLSICSLDQLGSRENRSHPIGFAIGANRHNGAIKADAEPAPRVSCG